MAAYGDSGAVWYTQLDYSLLTDEELMSLSGKLTSGRDKLVHWAHRQKYGAHIPNTIIGIVNDSMCLTEELTGAIFWRAITRI